MEVKDILEMIINIILILVILGTIAGAIWLCYVIAKVLIIGVFSAIILGC